LEEHLDALSTCARLGPIIAKPVPSYAPAVNKNVRRGLTALCSPALRISYWRLECRNEQCNLTFPRTGVAEGAE